MAYSYGYQTNDSSAHNDLLDERSNLKIMTTTQNTNQIRFKPPGINTDEMVGTIFEIHITDEFGTWYYVEAEGRRLQISPNAVLAPEQVSDIPDHA